MELGSGNDSFENYWKLLEDGKTVQCKTCNLRLNHGLDHNLLDSHVAWHQKAAQLKLKRNAKQRSQTQKNSWKTQTKTSPGKAAETEPPPIQKANMKKSILEVLVPEKKATIKVVEDTQASKSVSVVARLKCLTCPLKSITARAISVMQTVNKHTFKTIILLVTGVQASEKDVICVPCSKKAMQAFEFRQTARMQVNERISEGDEAFVVKDEYEEDVEFKPKTEKEYISVDDQDYKDDSYDDFKFSDVDDDDAPLQSLANTISLKSLQDGASEDVSISDEKTVNASMETKTELTNVIPTTVQTTTINTSNAALTVKCNQCSKTFSECVELLQHVKVAHWKNVFVSDKNKSKAKKRAIVPLLSSSKHKATVVKQKYVKKVKTSQAVAFRCGVCYVLFSDDAALETHLREHRDTEAMMCGVCSRVYHRFPHFKRHFATYHPEATDIIQAEATETLLQIENEEVRQHLVQYIRMTTIGDLISANVPLHEENEIRMFAHACGICGELSLSPEQAEEHKNHIHAAELAIRCFICGIAFGAGDKMGQYHTLNCQSRKLPSECIICGVKLRSSLVLEGHVQMQHPEEFARWEKNHCERKCDRCGGEFSSRDSLRYHRRVVCPEDDQAQYTCDRCNKRFRVKYYLLKHIERVHDRPTHNHVCPVCGKLVRRLNIHMTVHSGEKPYKCKYCPAAFRVSHERTYHERKHTQDSPYKCIPCNKLFNRPSSHRRHMMQHTGERPNKCTMCDAAFIQKNCLVAHMKKHDPYDQSLPLNPRPFEEPPTAGAEVEVITEEHSDSELDWAARKKKLSTYW